MNPALDCPFYEGTEAAFNSEARDADRYFDNIAGLFISRQVNWLEVRDDGFELVTDLNL